jgi:Family of unknown function (DUF6266)
MAILLNGPNGPFSGKLGTGVGYMWKGKAVVRSRPPRKRICKSPLQIQQQAKFALMHDFLKGVLSLLNVTYDHIAYQMTGFNKAFSYNVKNAITGEYPDMVIDYSMVLLGKGDLPNVNMPVNLIASEGSLIFNWTDNSGRGNAKMTDHAFAAVYCKEEKDNWEYKFNLTTRNTGSCSIDVSRFAGKEIQTYLGFISDNGKDVTNTLYTGPFNL